MQWWTSINSSLGVCKQGTCQETYVTSDRAGLCQRRRKKKVTELPEDGPCLCFSLLSWVESVLSNFVLRGLLSACSGS